MSNNQTTNTAKLEPISPLSDPMVGAIFANAEVAGIAAQSLISAITAEDNVHIGNIIEATPKRGCRMNVVAKTDSGETTIIAVNFCSDKSTLERDLFSAAQLATESVRTESDAYETPQKLPKIIAINFLAENICEDKANFFQPIKLSFTKPPIRQADDSLVIYNILLSQFKKTEADWNNNLHCWLYILNTARLKNLTLEEVIAMTPQLKPFIERDTGLRQFIDRYELALNNPKIRGNQAQS
jgi:hypothetical protein